MSATMLNDILSVASKIAPMIGGPAGVAAVEAAQAVIGLVEKAETIFSNDDQGRLTAVRRDLIARVDAHADRTMAKLSGA
jgi:hypothetical protein